MRGDHAKMNKRNSAIALRHSTVLTLLLYYYVSLSFGNVVIIQQYHSPSAMSLSFNSVIM